MADIGIGAFGASNVNAYEFGTTFEGSIAGWGQKGCCPLNWCGLKTFWWEYLPVPASHARNSGKDRTSAVGALKLFSATYC